MSDFEAIAVIPARGGSKSVPGKNLKRLGGHPLIAYSIAAALEAHLVARTIVTTDDPAIADVARAYGAEVPFIRPVKLAEDDTPDLPVFQHVGEWLKDRDSSPDAFVQLRPTSPFRPPGLVDEGIALLRGAPQVDSVRCVVETPQTPYKMWRMGADSRLVPLLTDVVGGHDLRRQDLPPVYWQTGHLDVTRPSTITGGSMSGQVIRGLEISPEFIIDIDTLLDWDYAEWVVASDRLTYVVPTGLH